MYNRKTGWIGPSVIDILLIRFNSHWINILVDKDLFTKYYALEGIVVNISMDIPHIDILCP